MEKYLKLGLGCLLVAMLTACPQKPKDPKDYYIEQAFGLSLTMIYVAGGEFMMGATEEQGEEVFPHEKPVHRVKLSPYHMSKCEITQAQWKAVMGTAPSYFTGDSLPVEKVSWYDAQTFCKKLSEKTGKKYTLPTEAQWEYAARGGKKSKRYKFSGGHNLNEVAWNTNNSGDKTHDVGSKTANELGLCDMSGNVWEWCADWILTDLSQNYYNISPLENPTGAESGEYRTLRGGSWHASGLDGCRVSFRAGDLPYSAENFIGFRVVCLP